MELKVYVEELARGGRKRLALKLGVSPSYLSRLLSGDRTITAERAIQIEDVTDGVVSRAALRPDIQWEQPKRPKKSRTLLPATLNQTIPVQRHHQQVAGSTVRPTSTLQAAL